jgi:5-methylcytosine-specific restriction endonuclease McrA
MTNSRQYTREYYAKNKDRLNEGRKQYLRSHPEKAEAYRLRWLGFARLRMLQARLLALNILSNRHGRTEPQCNCCGERQAEFLTIDHIIPIAHSKEKRIGNRTLFYQIATGKLPEKILSNLQVLCWNCNAGKRTSLNCPHIAPRPIPVMGG